MARRKTAEGNVAVRSIVVPIVGPEDATWQELREALRTSFAETTRCANWMLTELYLKDVKRTPEMATLSPMPKTYLYPEARAQFPNLAPTSVSSLEREVTRKYRARRYETVWLQSASLPVMHYPVGLPIPSQRWRLLNKDQTWFFSCRIGDRRFLLRLRGGHHFYRQREVIERVAKGELRGGAGVLYQIAARPGDHRSEVQPQKRLMLRLPVEMPIKTKEAAEEKTMLVKTTPDALIHATCGKLNWIEHNDHIRRGIHAAERQQQRLSDDLKAERRRPKRAREGIVQRMGEVAARRGLQVRSWLHEAAAHLIGYAARQHITSIEYDDSDRTFCAKFPWYELKQRIAEKCEVAGIQFVAKAKMVEEESEALVPEKESGEAMELSLPAPAKPKPRSLLQQYLLAGARGNADGSGEDMGISSSPALAIAKNLDATAGNWSSLHH